MSSASRSPRQRTRRFLTLGLLAALLLVSLAIVVSLPTHRTIEAEAQVMATRLDRALGRDASDARLRVAVLPFTVTGAARDEVGALGEALSLAVNDLLAAESRLQLVGRQSVDVVTAAGLPHAAAATVLGADFLLLGELLADGEQRLEVRASLWDAALGDAAWVLTADGTGPNLREVPRRIVTQLRNSFPLSDTAFPQDSMELRHLGEDDYRQYLMARYLARRGNARDATRAVAILEDLLQGSPGSLPVQIARARALLALNAITGDHWAAMVSALDELEREALPDFPTDPSLLGLAATAAVYRGDWPAALERCHRAIALDHHHVENLRLAAHVRLAAGYLEGATDLARRAALLDPLAAGSHQLLALLHGMRRQDGEMVRHAEIARDLGLDTAGYFLGFAHLRAAEFDLGVRKLRAALEAAGGPQDWLEPFASALRDARLRPAAIIAMDDVRGEEREFMNEFLVYYAMLGATDRALEALQRLAAYEPGEWTLHMWLPELATVRSEPGFGQLLADTSLPEAWRHFGPPDLCTLGTDYIDCR